MAKRIVLTTLHCLRCGHTWIARQLTVNICPHCKSAKWRQPRAGEQLSQPGKES